MRTEAAAALRSIGSDAREAVPALIAATRDENRSARGLAASALASIGVDQPAVMSALEKMLEDEDAHPRAMAVYAIAQLRPDGRFDERTMKKLTAMAASDPDTNTKLAASTVLGSMGKVREVQAGTNAPELAGGAAPGSWAGIYRDNKVTLELKEAPGGIYEGAVSLGDQKFPLSGQVKGNQLAGTFQSGNDRFEFTAALDGMALTFSTGGTAYALKKPAANPFAAPAANPLAAPPVNPLKRPETNTGTAAPHPLENRAAAAPAVQLAQYSLPDPHLGCTAWTFVAPADWKKEGGVIWTGRYSPMYSSALSVRNGDGSQEFTLFPTFLFAQTDQPILANGAELAPVMDAATCIRQVILQRCRRGVTDLRVVAEEALPKLAEETANRAQAAGFANLKVDSARVRVEYKSDGREMEEMIYCTVASAQGMGVWHWGTDRAFSCRAEKGKLKEAMPLLGIIGRSLRESPQWVGARRQEMSRIVAAATRPPQVSSGRGPSILDVSKSMARDQDKFLRDTDASIAARDRVGDLAGRFGRNTQDMVNPTTGERLEVNSGYLRYYQDYYGQIHASNDVIGDIYTTYGIKGEELKNAPR